MQPTPLPSRNPLLFPLRWVAGQFPDLDRETTVLGVAAAFLLLMQLYHAKAAQYFEWMPYLPDWAIAKDARFVGLYSYIFSHLSSVVILFLVPCALIVLVFNDSIRDYGLRMGTKREWRIVAGLYLVFLPILLFVAQADAFQAKYPKLQTIEDDAALFWIFEGVYLFKWLSWEFFFRGFLLFGFYKRFGEAAIVISTIPFAIAHFGKPEVEAIAAIAAGFVLCRIALDGRSIFPGMWLHFMVAGTMDFLASSWWR